VVWRRDASPGTGLEVVLIHRPAYDDWTFPKGKVEPGETDEEAAIREVAEETSLICELGIELASTAYHDRFGRAKLVRYWAMTASGGLLAAAHEVDGAIWVSPDHARRELSYARDLDVLDSFLTSMA
jgi:8-oxo-dGTP pyrophosphatase MutT (NUDIX family)